MSQYNIEMMLKSANDLGLMAEVDSYFETADGGTRVRMIMQGYVPARLRK